MKQEVILNISTGDVSPNGNCVVVDQDRLCYLIEVESRGTKWLRTFSKTIVSEYVEYLRLHPNANPDTLRNELCGNSRVDKFEYGYTSTIYQLALVALSKNTPYTSHIILASKDNSAPILQQIYYGAPGTGKSHSIKEQTKGKDVIRTTFHPDSDYSTFVGAYKPTSKEVILRDLSGHVVVENGQPVIEEKIVYEFVEQAFLQAYVKAWKYYAESQQGETPEEQYLVIEEINRGNCAQIFGDLFQLLDRNDSGFSDYPIKADNDMKKQLARAFERLDMPQRDAINALYDEDDIVSKVLKGDVLLLPNNLYIWATMNTSDQSLFPIDSAFKRRWDWKYVPIKNAGKNWRISVDNAEYDWWQFLTKVNEYIGSTTNSEDKKLGYFFCKAKDGKIDADTFVGKVLFYLWNDVFKDYGFDGTLFQAADGTTLTFDKFYNADTNSINEQNVADFLKNLGIVQYAIYDTKDEEDEEDEEKNNVFENVKGSPLYNDDINTDKPLNEYDRSFFMINDKGPFRKNVIATELMRLYVKDNPTFNAVEIVRRWRTLNTTVPRLVQLQSEYDAYINKSRDKTGAGKRFFGVTILDGTMVYVSNQFTLDRVISLSQELKRNGWPYTITREEE